MFAFSIILIYFLGFVLLLCNANALIVELIPILICSIFFSSTQIYLLLLSSFLYSHIAIGA